MTDRGRNRCHCPLRVLAITGITGWLMTIAAAAHNTSPFTITQSEKLDAAVFLNAVSSNPRFNSSFGDLRKEWPANLSGPETDSAWHHWEGRGIQLAYLLSALPCDDLEGTIRWFETPDTMLKVVRAGLDEPAYQKYYDELAGHPEWLRAYFRYLADNGFREMRNERYGDTLRAIEQLIRNMTSGIDGRRYCALLEQFAGRPVPSGHLLIDVLTFSQPFSFQLSGWDVGWASDTVNFWWRLTHEYLHKFNPSRENLESLRRLAEQDTFYHEAYQRIYREFDEGEEEEFVDAAARYITTTMGMTTPVRSLRGIKYLYYSASSGRGDMPVAAVLFDLLRNSPPAAGDFDYRTFIGTAFGEGGRLTPGSVKEQYRIAVRPVSGSAGMILRVSAEGAVVNRIFPGSAAEQCGIAVADEIIAVDSARVRGKPLEEILDMLAGPAGSEKLIDLHRGAQPRHIRLLLH